LVTSILLSVWFALGCAHTKQAASPRELFAKIQVGMSRSEVEALLGTPTVQQLSPDDEAWYLPPPRIEHHESPIALGTIGVRFTADGRVASKSLHPQFRDR
jgi:hypothetical protein